MLNLLFAILAAGNPQSSDYRTTDADEGAGEMLALDARTSLPGCSVDAPLVLVGGDDRGPGEAEGVVQGIEPPSLPDDSEYCPGYYDDVSVCLVVATSVSVRATVTDSEGVDTTMLVRDTAGELLRCDDDSAGELRPEVELQLEPGSYELLVGTYSRSERAAFRVLVQW